MTNINSYEMVLTNDLYTLKIVPTGKPEVGTGKVSAVKFSISKALLNELEKSGHTHILFTYDIGKHRLIAIFNDNNEDQDAV